MEDVEAEGEDPQLDQPVVPLRLLRRPPADDAQGYVEDRRQALRNMAILKQLVVCDIHSIRAGLMLHWP